MNVPSTHTPGHSDRAQYVKWMIPILAPVLGLLVAALMVTPMVGSKAQHLPVAVVNYDAGVTLPTGVRVDAGAQVVQALSASKQDVVDFEQVSEVELGAHSDYYAVIEIPQDYSRSVAAAQAAASSASAAATSSAAGAVAAKSTGVITATIDQSKPMMAVQVATTAIAKLAQNSPAAIELKTVNSIPSSWGIAGNFAPMTLFLGTFIGSLASAILITRVFPLRRARLSASQVWVRMCVQVLAAAVAALVVGAGVVVLIQAVSGLRLPFAQLAGFMVLVSVGYVLLTEGFIDLLGVGGIVLSAATMFLGMVTLSIPREFLPGFWRDLIFPWIPPRFAGEGIREILFAGGSIFNGAATAYLCIVALGLLLIVTAAAFKSYRHEQGASLDTVAA